MAGTARLTSCRTPGRSTESRPSLGSSLLRPSNRAPAPVCAATLWLRPPLRHPRRTHHTKSIGRSRERPPRRRRARRGERTAEPSSRRAEQGHWSGGAGAPRACARATGGAEVRGCGRAHAANADGLANRLRRAIFRFRLVALSRNEGKAECFRCGRVESARSGERACSSSSATLNAGVFEMS